MANKAFEVQDSKIRIGGVDLEAGSTGVVIPGVTRATNYRVEEVEDTGDQTYNTYTNITVVDAALYATIVAQGNESQGWADFTVELDDDGYIDNIEVNGQGTYSSANAAIAESNDMYAYIGTGSGGDRPLDPQDWIQIPFRPKMRAGEVETIGGGGSGNQLVSNNDGNTFALMDEGDVVFDGEGPGGVNRGLVWQYGDNLDGINSQVRQDQSGLTVRAWTENGGEGTYAAPVNIVTNQDLNQKTWTFDGAGSLTFPDGTIQTTAYTGQSGGGTSVSRFVMVNDAGTVTGSSDGLTWETLFDTGLSSLNRVAVGPNDIVYLGGDNTYHTTDWNVTPTLIADVGPSTWSQVRYYENLGRFVAVGSLINVPCYKHSTNGVDWTLVTLDTGWSSTLNGGDGPGNATFTDIAFNGTGFLLSTDNTTLGSFYTTTLTTNTNIGSAEWLNDGMKFSQILYTPMGDFTGWWGFGDGNSNAGDGWWVNSATNPADGSFTNSWGGMSDISASFLEFVGYEPMWSEIASGQVNGVDTIVIATVTGQVLYWPIVPAGPWVSIPKPYTCTVTDMAWNGSSTYVTLTGDKTFYTNGEKVTISGSSVTGYNGTYYIRDGAVFLDQAGNQPFDSSGLASFTGTATLTFSHGQYIDALNYVNGKFYVGNDDEEIFVSADGGETWTEVASLTGPDGESEGLGFMNDVDGFVGDAPIYQLINGEQSFTLNLDGTITAPTLTVNLHNGGNQQGQVLQFGDTQQQVIITGPTPTGNNAAQRLIIQGQHGSGTGEGGDVYLWGGDAQNNGGDIKIYAGDADSGTAGDSGGYINIEGGSGYSNGGDVTITGGNSTVNGGDVRIEGGGGSTPGKVQIQSLYSQWQFKPDGTLQLPTGGDIVDSNGTTVLGGGGTSTNGFDVLTDGTKQATVTEQENIANYNNELINGIPEFLSTAARSPDRQTLDTHYGFDGTGMWFTGDNQRYYNGAPSPAYPVFTANSFPSDAKAVVTFIFTLTDGNEDPGICFYPANGVPYWDWEPHPSRIAIMMDNETPAIYGLNRVSEGPTIPTGVSYRGRVTYEPVKNRTTFDVIALDTGRIVTSVWQDVRLPEGEAYRIGFDADWDEANPGDKSYFSDLTIVVGDDNLEVKTDFTLTGKIKLPSSVKGQINLNGPWQNSNDNIYYQAVTTHNGYAYLVGSDEWQQNEQIQLYKYSLTTGELTWKKVLFAGQDALFNFSWVDNAYALDNINNGGYGYQVGEELYIEGWTFSGGNGDNGLTIQVTGVTDSGAITGVTLSGTAPAGSGNITDVNPSNNQNRGNPTGISYDAVNNQLLVLFELWTGQGNNDDSNWTRAVILRVSPDTGAVIFSSTLKDEGDVRPWAIDAGSDGSPVVVGQKYNEYRQFGTLTMSNTGLGYFDILKSNLDEEYYPGTATPGVYSGDFWIEGSGIANKENVDAVNRYSGLATTTQEGSGATFDITADGSGGYTVTIPGPAPLSITTTDLATAASWPSTYVTINSDNIVTPGGWDTWVRFPSGTALATYMNANYTTNQVVPVTWGAGSTTINGFVIFNFAGDGSFDISPCYENVLSASPAAGTWYFPVAFGALPSVGSNYLVGHKINVLGSNLGGADGVNDALIVVDGVDNGAINNVSISGTSTGSSTYTGVSGTNYNVGSGCLVTLTLDNTGAPSLYQIDNVGANYVNGDIITVPGTQFPTGTTPADDVTLYVTDASGGVSNGVNSANITGGTVVLDSVRIFVDGVDFTVIGGEWTMKQNLAGEAFVWTADWNKCIGGATNDWFGSVTYSNDGQSHIYAVGSGRYDVNYNQSLVVKFDALTGNILWSKTINSFETDSEATGVAPMNFTTDIIVTGSEYHIAENRNMTYVARISATGSIVWKRFYDDNWNNWPSYSDVQVDSQDNIYISMSYNDNHGFWNNAFNVFKLNQDGIVIWTRALNSSGASSYLGNFDGIGWSSFDETTQQLVVAGYTYSFDDSSYCGLWAGFPADGFTYIGGEGSFAQQGPWRFGNGGKYLGYTESTTSADFTPTPLASNIDTVNNAKVWRTQDPYDRFPQWLTTMVDETNGGIVFGDGSKQTFATNIIPQIRAYNDYYLRPTDSGKHIYYAPNTSSGTIYIPYWDTVKLPVGFTFTIVNRCGNTIYVNLQSGNQNGSIYGAGTNSSSMYWGIPDSGSGSMVTLMKVEDGFDSNNVWQGDVWMISGPSDIFTN